MYPGSFLARGAARLRSSTWLQLAGYAYLGFVMLLLVRLLAPAELGQALRQLGLMLPLVLLAAKDLAHAPDALHRMQAATGFRARVLALLPPELVGMARLDRLMWRGCLQLVLRRRSPSRPDGAALTYLERGAYGTAICVFMVALFLELPVNAGMVHLLIDDADTRHIIHAVAAIGALYSFVWMLADRWYIGEGCHVLAEDTLHLRVGVRASGMIPLDAIERCERIDLAPGDWRRRHKIARADTVLVTPFDKPNCVLVMKRNSGATLLHWQVQRPIPRYLLLYVDRPELIASRISAG